MRNIFLIVIMLLAAFQNVGAAMPGSGKDTKAKVDPITNWIGSYDSVSGRCGDLLIRESKITWGSCKEAGVEMISVSAAKLVMKIDPSAVRCGWAGLVVALEDGEPQGATPTTSISAYQTLQDYKTKNRYVQCAYFKKE